MGERERERERERDGDVRISVFTQASLNSSFDYCSFWQEMSFLKHLWGDLQIQFSILMLYFPASFSGLKLTPEIFSS